MTYAAQVTDGTVTQVIVGTADWANERLDGTWVDTPTLVGIGWTYDGTFTPPAPDGGDDEQDGDDELAQ
jgi:hypothetical protein